MICVFDCQTIFVCFRDTDEECSSCPDLKQQVQVFNTFCFICCLQLVAAKREIKTLEQRIASSELKHSAAMEALQQPPAADAEKQALRAQVEELRAAALVAQREIGKLEGQVEVYKVVVLNDFCSKKIIL
jgi:hypothetical protein